MATSDGYVFISYKSEEKALADRIKSFLEQNGFKWWMAPDSLDQVGTQDYSADIFSAIRECTCLIFAVSPSSLSSKWVNREVKYANDNCGKPIIPFVVSAIPDEVQRGNPLFIILAMEKQILNSACTWDMKVLIPYLNKAFGISGRIAGSLAGASKGATGQQVNYKLSNVKAESDEGVGQATRLTVSTPSEQRSDKHESADNGSHHGFISYSRNDTLNSLGECLRNARLAKGYSVEQVAAKTRMHTDIVRELESGDYHSIRAPIYGRAFVMLYAKYLGLDAVPLLKMLDAGFSARNSL